MDLFFNFSQNTEAQSSHIYFAAAFIPDVIQNSYNFNIAREYSKKLIFYKTLTAY